MLKWCCNNDFGKQSIQCACLFWTSSKRWDVRRLHWIYLLLPPFIIQLKYSPSLLCHSLFQVSTWLITTLYPFTARQLQYQQNPRWVIWGSGNRKELPLFSTSPLFLLTMFSLIWAQRPVSWNSTLSIHHRVTRGRRHILAKKKRSNNKMLQPKVRHSAF